MLAYLCILYIDEKPAWALVIDSEHYTARAKFSMNDPMICKPLKSYRPLKSDCVHKDLPREDVLTLEGITDPAQQGSIAIILIYGLPEGTQGDRAMHHRLRVTARLEQEG